MSSCGVEETIDGLKAEVRHPDPVGIREREGHAHAVALGLSDVADFFRKDDACALVLCPGHMGGKVEDRRPLLAAQTSALSRAVDLSTLPPPDARIASSTAATAQAAVTHGYRCTRLQNRCWIAATTTRHAANWRPPGGRVALGGQSARQPSCRRRNAGTSKAAFAASASARPGARLHCAGSEAARRPASRTAAASGNSTRRRTGGDAWRRAGAAIVGISMRMRAASL